MKIFLKRIGAIILATIIGGGVGLLLAYLSVEGYAGTWTRVIDPPERPVRILAINEGLWVQAESGKIYYFNDNYYLGPENSHWSLVDGNAPADEQPVSSSPTGCGHVPSVRRFADSRAMCQSIGIAAALVVYAIDMDGNVYRWVYQHGDLEGMLFYVSPIIVGCFSLIVSIIVVVALYIRDFIRKRQARTGD